MNAAVAQPHGHRHIDAAFHSALRVGCGEAQGQQLHGTVPVQLTAGTLHRLRNIAQFQSIRKAEPAGSDLRLRLRVHLIGPHAGRVYHDVLHIAGDHQIHTSDLIHIALVEDNVHHLASLNVQPGLVGHVGQVDIGRVVFSGSSSNICVIGGGIPQ